MQCWDLAGIRHVMALNHCDLQMLTVNMIQICNPFNYQLTLSCNKTNAYLYGCCVSLQQQLRSCFQKCPGFGLILYTYGQWEVLELLLPSGCPVTHQIHQQRLCYTTQHHNMISWWSFAVTGSSLWNSLPAALRRPEMTLHTFKWQLQVYLLHVECVNDAIVAFFVILAPDIKLPTYLLTQE